MVVEGDIEVRDVWDASTTLTVVGLHAESSRLSSRVHPDGGT